MKLSQAKEYLPFVQAAADDNAWFSDRPTDYRIKPTPTLRPWKPEEVPVGALYRGKGWSKTERGLIIHSCSDCFEVGGIVVTGGFSFEYALESGEHSTDNGKTWKPCGIEE